MPPALCTACNAVFISKGQARVHLKGDLSSCTGAQVVFICTECKATFTKNKELKSHYASSRHGPETPIPRRHVPVGHSVDGNRACSKPKCLPCEEEFATFHELAVHQRDKHAKQLPVTLQCSRCMHSMSYGEVHTCNMPEVNAHAPELKSEPEKPHGQPPVTSGCERCLQTIPLGVVHACTQPKLVPCSICKQRFTPLELEEHRAENPVACTSRLFHVPSGTSLEDDWRLSGRHSYREHCKDKRGGRTDCASATTATPMPAGGVGQATPFSEESQRPNISVLEYSVSVVPLEQRNPQATEPENAQAGPAASRTECYLSGLPMLTPDGTSENAERALSSRCDNPTEEQAAAHTDGHSQPVATISTEGNVDPTASTHTTVKPEEPQYLDALVHEHGQHNVDPILSTMPNHEDAEANDNGERQHGSDDVAEETAASKTCSQPSPPPCTAEDLLKSLLNNLRELRAPPSTLSPPPPPRTAEELLKSVMSGRTRVTCLTLQQLPPPPLTPPTSSTSTGTSSSEGAVRPTSTRASISTCSQEAMRTRHNGQSSETGKHPMLAERKSPTKPPVQDEFIPEKVLLQQPEHASVRMAEWLHDQARQRSNCGWTISVQRPAYASAGIAEVPSSTEPTYKGKRKGKAVEKPAMEAGAPVSAHTVSGRDEDPPPSTAAAYAESQARVNVVEPPPQVKTEASHNIVPAARKARRISWHCRLCLAQPCVEPVVTFCGHIFCHR
ncbi:hypothetical protein C8Q73DRAFT_662359 [Cubamyces lactineus]|nr:hypothetical protein C8Q73DRAFT_662359 [Cubamyces lactineus]